MSLPTLSVASEFPYGEAIDFDVLTGGPTDGVVLRRAQSSRDKRVFRLNFKVASKATKDAVVALFRQVRGRAGRFNFTPPGGSPVVCRFASDELPAWQKITAAQYAFALEIMEA
jgi:hypothetical protein